MLPGIENAVHGRPFLIYFSACVPIDAIRQVIREATALEIHIDMSIDENAKRTAIDGMEDKPCLVQLPVPGKLLYIGHFVDPAETITTECG